MAYPNIATHVPIVQVQNKANTTPFTYANPELAGQTFFYGTPVMFGTGGGLGYVQAWDGTSLTNAILGVSESNGQNLATNGAGAPTPPWGGITGIGATASYPPPPQNQPNAVNIALGQPVADGRTLFMSPNPDNIFEAMFDCSASVAGNATDFTPVQSDVGKSYGLTKDANGWWYIDKFKTGANAAVQIVGINSVDGSAVNAKVRFAFLPAAAQLTF